MKNWPKFDHNGDLPVGIHEATLADQAGQNTTWNSRGDQR
jgi:hypothetical protein